MIYQVLKPLVLLSVKAFFNKVRFIGKENLEHDGAILVSNHPSALMDPLVIAVYSKKQPYFVAGAEWFGKGLKDRLFRKQFNMIPVQRPWLLKNGEKVSNDNMFDACYKALQDGERIAIYPEASSLTVPRVRELKTGAARIKLGADKYTALPNYTKVVPIGMNYSNAHRFYTNLLVNVGTPIDFGDVLHDPALDDKARAERMTEIIRQEMMARVLHIDSPDDEQVVKNVLKLMPDILLDEIGVASNDVATEFKVKKEIIAAVEYFKARRADETAALEKQLDQYIKDFGSTGLRRFNIIEQNTADVARMAVMPVAGFPFFLIGLALNILPFVLSKWIFGTYLLVKVSGEAKQGEIHPAFAGSLAYVLSFGIYLLWYTVLSVVAAQYYPFWYAVPLLLGAGYVTGRFAIRYIRTFSRMFALMKWKWLARTQPGRVQGLLSERRAIIQSLLALRRLYERAARTAARPPADF